MYRLNSNLTNVFHVHIYITYLLRFFNTELYFGMYVSGAAPTVGPLISSMRG